jgi:hypothetical protein
MEPAPAPQSFRRQLAAEPAKGAVWSRLFLQGGVAPGPAHLPPPPRPAGLAWQDAATERTRWSALLARHAGVRGNDFDRMMSLLRHMQRLSDAAVSRGMSAGRNGL